MSIVSLSSLHNVRWVTSLTSDKLLQDFRRMEKMKNNDGREENDDNSLEFAKLKVSCAFFLSSYRSEGREKDVFKPLNT